LQLTLPSKVKGWLNIQLTPEELLKAYHQNDDRAALARLVELYNRDLYHYLMSLSDRELAKDVLQITWLKVMKTSELKEYHLIKSWLFRIARNALLDEFKRSNKFDIENELEQAIITPSLTQVIEQEDQLRLFDQALNQLNFYQKEAIIFQQEGFSVAEIAQLTDESFETVKSRLRYGKSKLKQLLGENL